MNLEVGKLYKCHYTPNHGCYLKDKSQYIVVRLISINVSTFKDKFELAYNGIVEVSILLGEDAWHDSYSNKLYNSVIFYYNIFEYEEITNDQLLELVLEN